MAFDSSNTENLVRLTYKKTLEAQGKLRVRLEELIDENTFMPLKERDEWFNLVGDALLGQGLEIRSGGHEVDFDRLKGGNRARIGNIEDLLRFLPYIKNAPDGKPMSYFWEMALAGSRRVFPMAQCKAMSISAERFGRGERRELKGEMEKFK